MMFRLLGLAVVLLAAPACSQQTPPAEPSQAPATSPMATPATAPTEDAPAVKILKDLEAAGKEHKTIRADVVLEIIDRMTGDSEEREGWVAYQAADGNEPARFRVHFDTCRLGGGAKRGEKLDYAFDGRWLTEAKHNVRQMIRYERVPEGEEARSLTLAEGPFPLPFGQKAADVLEHFEVSTRATTAAEPKNTDYLKMVVKKSYRKKLQIAEVEMWVDRNKHLPVKIVSLDRNKKFTTVRLSDVKTGMKLSYQMFYLSRPFGWEYREEKLQDD